MWASTLMWVSTLIALVVGLIYNIGIAWHLYREKISNMLNEEYIRKKEIEFVVDVSDMWFTRHFFLFSSFKSDIFKMYHRVIFNFMQLLLCLLHSLMPYGSAKMGLILAIFVIFTLYIMATRPYRCLFSNILVFILSAT